MDLGKRAFVTGGTGAVGAHLVKLLLSSGWKVRVLHRKTSDVDSLNRLGADLVEGDLCDRDSMLRAVPKGVEAFYHLGADLNVWSRNNHRQEMINIGGTRHAVEAALAAGAGRFIHTSTISAYGQHKHSITEETPSVADRSPICYERSKWLAECEVRKGIAHGLDAIILNPCAIMGPGLTSGWADLLFQIKSGSMKALPPGEVIVNHIDDVAKVHMAAYEYGRKGENYILSGAPVSLALLIQRGADLMGARLRAKVMGPRLFALAGRIYGFSALLSGREPELTPELAALMSQKLRCPTDKAVRELHYNETPWERCLEEMYRWLHSRGEL